MGSFNSSQNENPKRKMKQVPGTYYLKPCQIFEVFARKNASLKARSGHRIVADESNIYSFGGYNPDITLEIDDAFNEDSDYVSPLFCELCKFNIASRKWVKLETSGESPNEVASSCVILSNDQLIVYGGTGVPFGWRSSNKLYVCNMKTLKWELIETTGFIPTEGYGQAMVMFRGELYLYGGTTGFEYNSDIYKLNIKMKEWKKLKVYDEPDERYRHEVAFYDKKIFVFGGGKESICFSFEKIPVFDIVSQSWSELSLLEDPNSLPRYPLPRRCHGVVQIDSKVYLIGGYNGRVIFPDVWMIDLEANVWTKLKVELPCPVYFHSTAVTPAGKLFIFGGVNDVIENTRVNRTFEMWLKIPSLKEACWEAVLNYVPNISEIPKENLIEIGIPLNYVDRVNFS